MTAFVILAAGRGTRVGRAGEKLHKALLPLGDRAVLSHLLALAPVNARLIICIGDRGQQLRDYVELAHPKLHVEFVAVTGWNAPGAGPGASLLAARDAVGDDDMIFTSCDTLWEPNKWFWDGDASWVGTASLPSGTSPGRWCRFVVNDLSGEVLAVHDKTDESPDVTHDALVYVGVAHINHHDLELFWEGVRAGGLRENERQVSGGFVHLLYSGRKLSARNMVWTDTGDEVGYRRAVAQHTGYDWTKIDQATYVLPEEHRVVKYIADPDTTLTRYKRGLDLGGAVPQHVERRSHMLAYRYVQGVTAYERIRWDARPLVLTHNLLTWRDKYLMNPVVDVTPPMCLRATLDFYRDKTLSRIQQLENTDLQRQAHDAVSNIDWIALAAGFQPAIIHGDLNFGNVIVQPNNIFVGIDWREDFAGRSWFDTRYDLAKLLAGTVVHWDNARRGDFRPWEQGPEHAYIIRSYVQRRHALRDVDIIGALSLINSAPLHASPLDEILIARGTSWLERVL